MSIVYMGVDPGKTGALAVLEMNGNNRELTLYDYDENLHKIIRGYTVGNLCYAAIERQHAFPAYIRNKTTGQLKVTRGSTGQWAFAENYGGWKMLFTILEIPLELPTPATWQKSQLSKMDGADTKARSIAAAKRLFPELSRKFLKTKHGRSDAALIAHWLFLQYNRGEVE